jgi:hypothetical protein
MGIVRDDLEVTTVVPVEECCYICREGIAEFECDMPRMYAKAITTFHDKHSEMGEGVLYCNRKMCKKCAVEVNPGIHFCVRCARELKSKLANMSL